MEEQKGSDAGQKGCGCGSGHRCCGCKAIAALVLLLVGGVIGWFIGHCHRGAGMCPVMSAPMQSAPAAPAQNGAPQPGKK